MIQASHSIRQATVPMIPGPGARRAAIMLPARRPAACPRIAPTLAMKLYPIRRKTGVREPEQRS